MFEEKARESKEENYCLCAQTLKSQLGVLLEQKML